MSLNTADANNAVLLHSGEYILLHLKDTVYEFFDNDSPEFEGTKSGHTYLTSHRVIFRNSRETDLMSSLSMPFIAMRNVGLKEDTISGTIQPQPNGNFAGESTFVLTFKYGGATEFIQALMVASYMVVEKLADSEFPLQLPPFKPATAWYEPSISAYQRPKGYFDWVPQHEAFTPPCSNSVYITDDPPPFPGISEPSIRDCWEFECEPFARPSRRYRCPPQGEAMEDETPDDVYNFSPIDGLFPSASGEDGEEEQPEA